MDELRDLLTRSTDRIESPRLEHAALQIARRRRTRRRGTAAAAVASALAVTIVVSVQGGDRRDSLPPSSPSSHTPTTDPMTTDPTSTPGDAGEKVWPQWDPRDVDQLPASTDGIAPQVPEVIDSPDSSPALGEDPVAAAVLAVEQDGVAQLLGTDGAWRTVPLDGRFPGISLSPDGTRFAVQYYYDSRNTPHDYGVTVHDLAAGTSRKLEAPEGFEPWDTTGWSFLDEDRMLFSSGPQAWVVAIESGEVEETTAPSGMVSTLDPAGNWLSGADFTEPNVLTDYAGGTPREVSMDRIGRLVRLQASADLVVGATYDDQPFNVVVADRETLTPQFRLPVLDYEGNYSNWGLGVVAVADDGTVLLRIAAIGRKVDGFRLVAWDPSSGDLSIVSSTALPVEAGVVFASAMLRETGPG